MWVGDYIELEMSASYFQTVIWKYFKNQIVKLQKIIMKLQYKVNVIHNYYMLYVKMNKHLYLNKEIKNLN